MNFDIYHGDCVDVMSLLIEDNSIDAIVCDPPAGIGFMGKEWDHHKGGRDDWIKWMQGVAEEALRVLKPGGHALVWAIPRTSHWTATAWENAGFEIRDRIAHVFGAGFPKSMDISKAIDKAAGAEREVVGARVRLGDSVSYETNGESVFAGSSTGSVTAPATEAAKRWAGWGTALKPAVEDWWLLRKPLIGTVAENVLTHGTGGLNIDGCRAGRADGDRTEYGVDGDEPSSTGNENTTAYGKFDRVAYTPHDQGRFPSHLIHDGSAEVLAVFPDSNGAGKSLPRVKVSGYGDGSVGTGESQYFGGERIPFNAGSGSAARFFKECPPDDEIEGQRVFYCPKAGKKDREEGLDGFEIKRTGGMQATADGSMLPGSGNERTTARANVHPTVKNTELMKYLCRLIAPPGGTILDPFMGSGSTGKAAMLEGFNFIGIEREAEYVEIARARIQHAHDITKR